MEPIRLNKLLAEQLGLSRREADSYISTGRVLVNGAAPDLGKRVSFGTDIISIDGRQLSSEPVTLQYLMLNKPAGYICSRRRQGDTPTIYELLPSAYQKLKPVGRLDKDSSGLLLLTNDGDFAHRMTHPSFRKVKTYFVTLDLQLQPLHQQMIHDYGIHLDDGNSQLTVTGIADTQEANAYPPNTYKVEMAEGRNRQIRRTFAALGYAVNNLHRTEFGPYKLGALASSTFSSFTP